MTIYWWAVAAMASDNMYNSPSPFVEVYPGIGVKQTHTNDNPFSSIRHGILSERHLIGLGQIYTNDNHYSIYQQADESELQ